MTGGSIAAQGRATPCAVSRVRLLLVPSISPTPLRPALLCARFAAALITRVPARALAIPLHSPPPFFLLPVHRCSSQLPTAAARGSAPKGRQKLFETTIGQETSQTAPPTLLHRRGRSVCSHPCVLLSGVLAAPSVRPLGEGATRRAAVCGEKQRQSEAKGAARKEMQDTQGKCAQEQVPQRWDTPVGGADERGTALCLRRAGDAACTFPSPTARHHTDT
jgi:hypothetical protein